MKYLKLLFAVCSILALTGVGKPSIASEHNSLSITNNSLELNSLSSSDSFQIAKSTFLPDAGEDLGWGGRNSIKNNHVRGDNCASYPLSSCPSKGICSKCPFGPKYRLRGCDTYYKVVGSACQVADCRAYGSSIVSSIPSNSICSIKTTSPLLCYQGCRKTNCSGYEVECSAASAMSNVTGTAVCPDCSNASVSNCSKRMCKITSCGGNMKVNASGTACIEKDDTCPTDYYKTCATGTQGDPKYTERGTACYQCKAAGCDVWANYRNQDGVYNVSATQCSIMLYGQYNTTNIPAQGVSVEQMAITFPSGSTFNGGPITTKRIDLGTMGGGLDTTLTFNMPVTVNGKIYIRGNSKFVFNKGITGNYTCIKHETNTTITCPFGNSCNTSQYYSNQNGVYNVGASQASINLYGQSNTTNIPSGGLNVCFAGWTYPSGATINGGALNVNGSLILGEHGGQMTTRAVFNVPVTVNGKIQLFKNSMPVFNKGISGNYTCYSDYKTVIECPFSNKCDYQSVYKNTNGTYTASSSQTAINLYGQSNTTNIPSGGLNVCFAGWTYPSGATINGGPLNVNGVLNLGEHGGHRTTQAVFNVPVTVNGKILLFKNSRPVFNKGISGNYTCYSDNQTVTSCPF